jgi:hypothetical protein
MNALAIIRDLEARDIRLELGDGCRLVVDAPKGALDPEEIEQLRSAKSAILALLGNSVRTNLVDRDPIPDPRISPQVAAEIRRIETVAYRLGWRRERLWNRDFWPHTRTDPRGLASVLSPGDRIIEVNEQCIQLVSHHRKLRFFRCDG